MWLHLGLFTDHNRICKEVVYKWNNCVSVIGNLNGLTEDTDSLFTNVVETILYDDFNLDNFYFIFTFLYFCVFDITLWSFLVTLQKTCSLNLLSTTSETTSEPFIFWDPELKGWYLLLSNQTERERERVQGEGFGCDRCIRERRNHFLGTERRLMYRLTLFLM